MRYIIHITLIILFLTGTLTCQKDDNIVPESMFEVYGGEREDGATDIIKTSDGGFLVVGITSSLTTDMQEVSNTDEDEFQNENIWILKFSQDYSLEWQSCIGGSEVDFVKKAIETPDNNYILLCNTASTDIEGMHKTGDYWMTPDIWVVKMDNNGNIVNQNCLGGNDLDWGNSISATQDGGVLIAGYTRSSDGDVQNNHRIDAEDAWILKLKNDLTIDWTKCLGGFGNDRAFAAYENNNTYIILATTESNDGDRESQDIINKMSIWYILLDSAQNITNQKVYPQLKNYRSIMSSQKTGDNSIILTICMEDNHYYENQFRLFYNSEDIDSRTPAFIKMNNNGNLIWINESFHNHKLFYSSSALSQDNGYVFANQLSFPSDDKEIWVLKLNNSGKLVTEQFLGGEFDDAVTSIIPINASEYIITGFTERYITVVNSSYDVFVHTINVE